MKRYQDLTVSEFKKLKSAGMINVIYPECPDDYDPKQSAPPKPLKKPDWSKVIAQAEAIVEKVATGSYQPDNDDSHYIYEEVMMTIYGRDYFEWYNSKVD